MTAVTVPLEQRAPFRNHAEHGPVDCQAAVEGRVPDWLVGDLVRTAPAIFERPEVEGQRFKADHWFDGLGVLFGFQLRGGVVRFRQRLMETDVEREARTGLGHIGTFGTRTRRGFFRRLISPVPQITDNTNVNILPFGDERVALTESPHQWVVDPESLAVTARRAYAKDGFEDLVMIAHAHFDFARNVVVNAGSLYGPSPALVVYEHGPGEATRREVGRVKASKLPYLHAFGLTPKHAVLIGHPLEVNPLAMLFSNKGFIDHFHYRPEKGTTLWVMDRSTGVSRAHHAPAGFVFHVVNAFEDGADTVLDVAQYPDASIVSLLSRAAIEAQGLPDLAPSIVRYRLSPGREEARVEVLLQHGFEFPAVSYRKVNGQRHEVSWGARVLAGGGSVVIRADSRGQVLEHREAGMTFGEPVFVAKPGAEAEDAGVLLTVGAHETEDRSELRVLDAQTLDVLARARVPVPIPLGFHGSFFRARGSTPAAA